MKEKIIPNEEKLTQKDFEELERVLLRCWHRLHPDEELLIISLPKHDSLARRNILNKILEIHTSDAYENYCKTGRIDI